MLYLVKNGKLKVESGFKCPFNQKNRFHIKLKAEYQASCLTLESETGFIYGVGNLLQARFLPLTQMPSTRYKCLFKLEQ